MAQKVIMPVSNKEYDIIDTMTRKEVKEAGRLMMQFVGFDQKLAAADEAGITKLLQEIENRSPESDAFMFKVFNRCVSPMSKEYFEDELRNVEAIILFNTIFKASTEVPLEYVKPSGSSSGGASQTTQSTTSPKQ